MPQQTDSANYRNSRPFDVHVWSEQPRIRDLTNELFEELRQGIPFRADPENHKKHLRVLLLDLYHRYLEDQEGWIGLSLNRNNYSGPRRYNKLFLAYRPMSRIVKLLREHGYIEWVRGFHDRSRGVGYQSRIRSGDRLKRIFTGVNEEIGCLPFNERPPDQYQEEVLILRDNDGNNIDYLETDQTRLMRNRLTAYNDFLRGSYLDVSLRGWDQPERIDLTQKTLRRIFNNASWEQGGRFYGGWWENCSRGLRRRIVISQKPTIEIDYAALHIVLLYARRGIDYWTDGEQADPYLNERIFRGPLNSDQHRRLRDAMKTLYLTAINASGPTQALRGARQDIAKEDATILGEVGVELGELLTKFNNFHRPIAEYLYSGMGIHLLYVDSLITEHILDAMLLREGVPVLPVHDSYVCCVRDDQHLREAVSEAMDTVLAERGWARVGAKTKEKMGELYSNPERERHDGDFFRFDVEEVFADLDHDLERRQQLWWQSKQQEIINYTPT